MKIFIDPDDCVLGETVEGTIDNKTAIEKLENIVEMLKTNQMHTNLTIFTTKSDGSGFIITFDLDWEHNDE